MADRTGYSPWGYWAQSTLGAYYYIHTVTIDDNSVGPDDWVGSFRGDVLVGARQWNTSLCGGGVCDVPVMGDDGYDWTAGYMLEGDIPTFQIFRCSNPGQCNPENFPEDFIYNEAGTFYPAVTSETPVGFRNLLFTQIDNLNGQESSTLFYSFNEPYNLVSFPLILDDNSIESVFGNDTNYNAVLGEGQAAYNQPGGWLGALAYEGIDPQAGYWINILDWDPPETLNVTGNPMGNPTYTLHDGPNLISFPGIDEVEIECAFPDNVANHITAVIGQGESAINCCSQIYDCSCTGTGTWFGALKYLKSQKGYWVDSEGDVSFQFNLNCPVVRTQTFEHMYTDCPTIEYDSFDTGDYQKILDCMNANAGGRPKELPGSKILGPSSIRPVPSRGGIPRGEITKPVPRGRGRGRQSCIPEGHECLGAPGSCCDGLGCNNGICSRAQQQVQTYRRGGQMAGGGSFNNSSGLPSKPPCPIGWAVAADGSCIPEGS